MAEAVRKRFWDLEKSAEMFRIERDTLIKRVKHLEWFDREMREKQATYEATHKLYRDTTEAKLRELTRDLEMAKGEAVDAREEVELSDITIDGLNATIGDLRKQLADWRRRGTRVRRKLKLWSKERDGKSRSSCYLSVFLW